jgi:hypothetical protein
MLKDGAGATHFRLMCDRKYYLIGPHMSTCGPFAKLFISSKGVKMFGQQRKLSFLK